MAHTLDTRLQHLLKLRKEAQADVKRYVEKKWPVGTLIRFMRRGVTVKGVVKAHRPDVVAVRPANADTVVSVSYDNIKQNRNAE